MEELLSADVKGGGKSGGLGNGVRERYFYFSDLFEDTGNFF